MLKFENKALTDSKLILDWIEEMAEMVNPDKIVWIDGSEEQTEALKAEACSIGELEKLRRTISAKLRTVCQLDIPIKFVSPNTLKRFEGKAKRVKDLRKKD